MRNFFHLIQFEIRALLISPATYVAATLSMLMMGFFYFLSLVTMAEAPQDELPSAIFFRFFLFPVVLFVPMLTMRSIAGERRQGTLATLMTTPVNAATVVLSKFIAAYLFYLGLWIIAIAYPLITAAVLPSTEFQRLILDLGTLIGGYSFIACTGLLFVAIGIFTSSLTRSQLVAGMLSFSIIFLLIVGVTSLSYLGTGFGELNTTLQNTFHYLAAFDHYSDAVHGLLDTRPLVYYISAAALVLGLATLVVESKT